MSMFSSELRVRLHSFFHSVQVLQERTSRSTLRSAGIYITLFLGLLASSLVLHNNLNATDTNLVFVSLQPLFLPLLVCVSLIALYLAIVSSITVSRERDRATLEVLVFGPVNEAAFLWGVFLAQLKIYLTGMVVIFVWANLLTWFLHMAFSLRIVAMLLTSTVMAAAVIAFGLLTAVWGGHTRTALVYFFMSVLLLSAVQIGNQILVVVVLANAQSASGSMLLLRNSLEFLSGIFQWISPLTQFTLCMDAIADNAVGAYLLHLGILLIQAGILFAGSIQILRRKGVRG